MDQQPLQQPVSTPPTSPLNQQEESLLKSKKLKKWLIINAFTVLPTVLISIYLAYLQSNGTSGTEFIAIYLTPLYLATFVVYIADFILLTAFLIDTVVHHKNSQSKVRMLAIAVWLLLTFFLVYMLISAFANGGY